MPSAAGSFSRIMHPDILAWPTDRAAYGRLCRLLTLGNRRAPKGECHLDLADLLEWGEGLMLGVVPDGNSIALGSTLAALRDAFPGAVRLMLRRDHGPDDHRRMTLTARTARRFAVPLMATNDVLYHAPERRRMQDVITCIREHKTLVDAGRLLAPNAERHLKPPQEMARLFRDFPESLAETTAVFERLAFSLDELSYQYPDEPAGDAASPQEALVRLTEEGARQRFPAGVPAKIRESLEHELALIDRLHFAAYFLTVHDIIRFARAQGHPLPGPRLGRQFGRLLLPRHHRGRTRRPAASSSNASSPRSAASRPTSTSISSTSGARR